MGSCPEPNLQSKAPTIGKRTWLIHEAMSLQAGLVYFPDQFWASLVSQVPVASESREVRKGQSRRTAANALRLWNVAWCHSSR